MVRKLCESLPACYHLALTNGKPGQSRWMVIGQEQKYGKASSGGQAGGLRYALLPAACHLHPCRSACLRACLLCCCWSSSGRFLFNGRSGALTTSCLHRFYYIFSRRFSVHPQPGISTFQIPKKPCCDFLKPARVCTCGGGECHLHSASSRHRTQPLRI